MNPCQAQILRQNDKLGMFAWGRKISLRRWRMVGITVFVPYLFNYMTNMTFYGIIMVSIQSKERPDCWETAEIKYWGKSSIPPRFVD